MRAVIASLVVTAVVATLVLLAGVLLGHDGVARAGLIGLLLVPVVRNVAFSIVEKRAAPRALSVAVGVALLVIYLWFLR